MKREAPIELTPEEFRALGHRLVDDIAAFLGSLPGRKVTSGDQPSRIRSLLGTSSLPASGERPALLLAETQRLLFGHSLFNSHPKFFGYITAPAAPIGILGDLLASAANPNTGSFVLSPAATEIEAQTIRWIAELIGYPAECGGILVSGGNMANFICFLAARRAKTPWDIRTKGIGGDPRALRFYCSAEAHTWVQKAADLFGLGTDAIRWVPTDAGLRLDPAHLAAMIEEDRKNGHLPFMAVGTAGTVGTGAIDPLADIARICRDHDLWFHVDGAYGAPAAALPEAPPALRALGEADSIAVDPHKWLYAPLEVGCALVRRKDDLKSAFSYQPGYFRFQGDPGDEPTNFFELGMQNSRGFRALKVWLALRHVGREGYIRMIGDDIALARHLFACVKNEPELEAGTLGLSIATFRYVPAALPAEGAEAYLNTLNSTLCDELQRGGDAFVSNALLGGRFFLRACIVNFRTTEEDCEALPRIIVELGRKVDRRLRPH
jgi:glutamate/tyrosine decarboxylase-like PLP-dependent enzyme